ncbi:hypothetical protein FHW23_001143 [Curtobacterium pusillum]|uniref:WXG100 family type VII secretion target n=1 Tax=Curtobacterium pusillum TaxID=69373 RepID=A0AAW3T5Q9_9MICO|nr:hypothetical protein [Curtobacterium pusillum]MBA8989897.1 hypothetical protein [Curtobacterium pusillum]
MTFAPTVNELPDPSTLESVGSDLVSAASTAQTQADAIEAAWKAFASSDVYDAPEAATLRNALSPIDADVVGLVDAASKAKSALDSYSMTVQTLQTQRATLLSDIKAFAGADTSTPADATDEEVAAAEQARDDQQRALQRRVDQFNAAALQADQECAGAINALKAYEQSAASKFLSLVGGGTSGAIVGGGMSVSQETLERWRQLTTVPAGVIPEATLRTPPPAFIDANGKQWWRSPSGLEVPYPPKGPDIPLDDPRYGSHNLLVKDKNALLEAMPDAAKGATKVLGVAGTVLTLGSTWNDQWHEDEVDHPDWSDSRRTESAVTTTVIKGGTTVGAAAAGAWIGGAIGTALFPGVGTVVGGIVGSAIGGWLGGTGGEMLGDKLNDMYQGSDFAKGVHDVWKGIFG